MPQQSDNSFINTLPKETWASVFRFFDHPTLHAVRQLSRAWRELADGLPSKILVGNQLWRYLPRLSSPEAVLDYLEEAILSFTLGQRIRLSLLKLTVPHALAQQAQSLLAQVKQHNPHFEAYSTLHGFLHLAGDKNKEQRAVFSAYHQLEEALSALGKLGHQLHHKGAQAANPHIFLNTIVYCHPQFNHWLTGEDVVVLNQLYFPKLIEVMIQTSLTLRKQLNLEPKEKTSLLSPEEQRLSAIDSLLAQIKAADWLAYLVPEETITYPRPRTEALVVTSQNHHPLILSQLTEPVLVKIAALSSIRGPLAILQAPLALKQLSDERFLALVPELLPIEFTQTAAVNPAFVKRFNFIQRFKPELAESFFRQRSGPIIHLLTQEAFLKNLTFKPILALIERLSGNNFTNLMQNHVFLAYLDRQGSSARSQFLLLSAKRCSPFAEYIIDNSIIRAWLEPETLKSIALESYDASFLLLRLQQQGSVVLTEQHLSKVEEKVFKSLSARVKRQGLLETDADIQFLYQTYHTRLDITQRYSTMWQHLVAEAVKRQLISSEADITLQLYTEKQKKSLKKSFKLWNEIIQNLLVEEESDRVNWERQTQKAKTTNDFEKREKPLTHLKLAGLGLLALLGLGMLVIGAGPWLDIPLVAQVLIITVGSLLCLLSTTGLIFVAASCSLAALSHEPCASDVTPVTTPLLQPNTSYRFFLTSQTAPESTVETSLHQLRP